MGTNEFNPGGNPMIAWHPIQGKESKNTPSFLMASNEHKPWLPGGLLAAYMTGGQMELHVVNPRKFTPKNT